MIIDLVLVLSFFLPLYTGKGVSPEKLTVVSFPDALLLMIGQILLSVIAAAGISMYSNRLLQIKISRAGLLLSVLLLGFAFGMPNIASGLGKDEPVGYGFGIYLLILNPVMFYLAAHFIKKDEDLVRSADRLR
ncbi:MAG: hypothetical protein Fur0041_13870 [Bacteroidia bacterium]